MGFSLFPNRLLPQVWGQSIGLVTIVLVATVVLSWGTVTRITGQKLEESAVAFAKGSGTTFANHLRQSGMLEALRQLEDFEAIPGLEMLAIIDDEGRIQGAVGTLAKEFVRGSSKIPTRTTTDGQEIRHQNVPMMDQLLGAATHGHVSVWRAIPKASATEKTHWIYLQRNVDDVYRAANLLIAKAMMAVLVGVGLIGMLMHRLIRQHVQGIDRIVDFAKVLGTKDAEASEQAIKMTGLRGTQEIKQLALSLQKASSTIIEQQKELVQGREHVQNLLDASVAGVVTFNEALRVVEFNAAAERIYGYCAADVIGEHLNMLGAGLLNDVFTPYVKQFLVNQSGLPLGVAFELKAIHRSGETRDVEVVLADLSFDGKTRICASVIDITAKNKWIAQLAVQRDRAEAANKAKSHFLANMSHELRTPMNGIIGMTELALETELNDEQREYMDTVASCARQLMAVVNDVLDYSKIEAGKVKIDSVDFGFGSLVSDVTRSFQAKAKKNNVALVVESDVAQDAVFIGDPTRIRQVLFNLMDNAFKFTSEGSVTLKVSASYGRDNSPEEANEVSIVFAVIDSGIGIAESKHQIIFDLFAQADDSTSRRFGGTGLGLALCKKLSNAMEGDVWLESTVGVGTTFYFSTKVEIAQEGSENSAAGTNLQADIVKAAEKFQGKRVLVAEDDPVNAAIVLKLLRKLNCDVTHVADGIEAVELCTRTAFDLVLIDLAMPGLSGIEVTRRLREWERARAEAGISLDSAYVIALSCSLRVAAREDCLMVGCDDYLLKPFTPTQFFHMLAAQVDKDPATRALGVNQKLEIFNSEVGAERLGLDLTTIAELARLFLSQLPQFKQEIMNASVDANEKQLRHWLHSLTGSLLTLGAHRAGHFAKQLESVAAQLTASDRQHFVRLMLKELTIVEGELSLFVARYADKERPSLLPA
jgi:PAS domain S-box-containing protein